MNYQQIHLTEQPDQPAKPSSRSPKAAGLPPKQPRRARQTAGSEPASKRSGRRTSARSEIERAVAALETEAVRRALAGVTVPVFHQGRECGSTVKHSDQLLMFLLKTLKPERYAGTKEPAPTPQPRIFSLDIELPGQDETDGEAEALEEAEETGEEA